MTYRSRRDALLLSFALCLAAPAWSLAAESGDTKNAEPAKTEAPKADAPKAEPAKEETKAESTKAEAPKSRKPKKEYFSDTQRRHADEGYYSNIQNGQSDQQKRHADEGYYSDVKQYKAPPPSLKPDPPPLTQPLSVGPPPLVVPSVGSQIKGDKFDDDTGTTGSVTATRHAKQAKELYASGHFDMAKRHYHETLGVEPNQPELYPNYWECCAKTNDWGEARRALDKFFEIDPSKKKEYAWAYAQTWYELKNWDKAIPALNEALKCGSHIDDLHQMLLKIALQQHNNNSIPIEYNALLKLHPNDYKTHLDFANWLEVNQRHSEAIPHYRAAVNAQPSDGATAGRLAYMLMFYNKDFKGAVTYYKIAMTADPTNAGKYQDGIRYAESQMNAGSVKKREQQ